jgi:D-tyrosyl-tRNA(Tyr) deacylase
MKVVLQRVKQCAVTIDGTVVGRIGPGILILLGIDLNDAPEQADYLAEKCAFLRIFSDDEGKMNRCVIDTGGEALVVSQFTLLGDCSRGRRPSFTQAAGPEKGKELYDYFVSAMRRHVSRVETGVFGAMMDVELVNDGPVTLILEKQREAHP